VAYCPNPPQGPFTVYAQHNAFFNSIARDIRPRQAFLVDLKDETQKSLEAGDHVVLLLDGNSSMKGSDLSNVLQQLSLKESIISKHGNSGPATHNVARCSYFAYDEVVPSELMG